MGDNDNNNQQSNNPLRFLTGTDSFPVLIEIDLMSALFLAGALLAAGIGIAAFAVFLSSKFKN